MVERSRIRLLGGALASVFAPGLAGCYDPLYEGPPPAYPPRYYDYYYYPSVGVYFDFRGGWYYYHDRGRWWRVRRLPPRFRLDRYDRRVLRIPEREPWRRNEEHRRRFQAPRRPRRGNAPPAGRPPARQPGASSRDRDTRQGLAPGRPAPPPRRDADPGPSRALPPEPRRVAPSPGRQPGTPPYETRQGPAPRRPEPPPSRGREVERGGEADRDREERERNSRRSREFRERGRPPGAE